MGLFIVVLFVIFVGAIMHTVLPYFIGGVILFFVICAVIGWNQGNIKAQRMLDEQKHQQRNADLDEKYGKMDR